MLTALTFASLGLAPNCFDFPDRSPSFTPSSFVDICSPGSKCGDTGLGISTGAAAANFTLGRADGGGDVSLAALLATKPVLVEFGSFT
jgi:hypothetical protein